MCDLLWSDPDKDITGWSENDRGVSFTFGPDVVSRFLQKHDMDLICRAHQVVEDGYEFFSKRQLVTLFSAPNYCGEFDNAGAMMSVDESLLCSFQVSGLGDSLPTQFPGIADQPRHSRSSSLLRRNKSKPSTPGATRRPERLNYDEEENMLMRFFLVLQVRPTLITSPHHVRPDDSLTTHPPSRPLPALLASPSPGALHGPPLSESSRTHQSRR